MSGGRRSHHKSARMNPSPQTHTHTSAREHFSTSRELKYWKKILDGIDIKSELTILKINHLKKTKDRDHLACLYCIYQNSTRSNSYTQSGNCRRQQVREFRVRSRGHEISWRHRDFPSQILYDESSRSNEHQTVFTLPLDRGLLLLVWLNNQDFETFWARSKEGTTKLEGPNQITPIYQDGGPRSESKPR